MKRLCSEAKAKFHLTPSRSAAPRAPFHTTCSPVSARGLKDFMWINAERLSRPCAAEPFAGGCSKTPDQPFIHCAARARRQGYATCKRVVKEYNHLLHKQCASLIGSSTSGCGSAAS